MAHCAAVYVGHFHSCVLRAETDSFRMLHDVSRLDYERFHQVCILTGDRSITSIDYVYWDNRVGEMGQLDTFLRIQVTDLLDPLFPLYEICTE